MEKHINTSLWERFWRSSPQQQAHTAINAEIARFGIENADIAEIQMWRNFMENFVLEISIFGYCIFQLAAKGTPTILGGRHAELMEIGPKKFKPRAFGSSRRKFVGTTGWKVIVFHEPVFNMAGKYVHPTSAAYKSLHSDEALQSIISNMARRDTLNSNPSIYTSISKDIRSNRGDHAHPWFPTLASEITGAISMDDLVRERVQTIDSLNTVTSHVRMVELNHKIGDVPIENTPQHDELVVSDGRDYSETRHLTQDSEIIRNTVERLNHEIMFAWGVPPQVRPIVWLL